MKVWHLLSPGTCKTTECDQGIGLIHAIEPINRAVPDGIEEAIADDVALSMEQLKKFIESQS
jgi:hypothetical protein